MSRRATSFSLTGRGCREVKGGGSLQNESVRCAEETDVSKEPADGGSA